MDPNFSHHNHNNDSYYNVWGTPGATSSSPLPNSFTNSRELSTNTSYFADSLAGDNAYPIVGGDWEPGFHTLRINDQDETVFPSTLLNYKPEFKTLVPPLHFGYDEVHWMHPMRKNFHQLLLDPLEGPVQDQIEEIKYESECQLFNSSIEEPLPFALRQNLLREIENHPDIVNHFALTPSSLPGIVTHNQQLAIAILLALMEQRDITELLDVLVEMEVSINTMEVVNRLANNLEPGSEGAALPRPFLHLYISNCIVHCGKMPPSQLQNRQVRLVCVFLLSLFRNHIIEIQIIPQPLLFEIEAFCIEFGRLREATALFSHIKELESAETALEAAIAKAFDMDDDDKAQAENKNGVKESAGATSNKGNSPHQIDTKQEP